MDTSSSEDRKELHANTTMDKGAPQSISKWVDCVKRGISGNLKKLVNFKCEEGLSNAIKKSIDLYVDT